MGTGNIRLILLKFSAFLRTFVIFLITSFIFILCNKTLSLLWKTVPLFIHNLMSWSSPTALNRPASPMVISLGEGP